MRAATIEREQYREVFGSAVVSSPNLPRRSGYRAALLWSIGGFLAGALFWYAAGFWRFVSDIVLDPRPQPATTMTAIAQPSDVTLPTIYLVDPVNCTALILDRKTNSTEMRPCPQQGLALRLEANSERASLAAVSDPTAIPAPYHAN